MNRDADEFVVDRQRPGARATVDPARLLSALPNPVLALDGGNRIIDANSAAEAFFEMGLAALRRQRIEDLLPFSSPVLGLLDQARERRAAINEYRVDLGTPRIGAERVARATPDGSDVQRVDVGLGALGQNVGAPDDTQALERGQVLEVDGADIAAANDSDAHIEVSFFMQKATQNTSFG